MLVEVRQAVVRFSKQITQKLTEKKKKSNEGSVAHNVYRLFYHSNSGLIQQQEMKFRRQWKTNTPSLICFFFWQSKNNTVSENIWRCKLDAKCDRNADGNNTWVPVFPTSTPVNLSQDIWSKTVRLHSGMTVMRHGEQVWTRQPSYKHNMMNILTL